jgi:predicted dehydrogenase
MIRAALVGVSGYGRWHLLMAMEQMLLGRLKLVGVTVIDRPGQETICRRLGRLGVPVFDTFDQMMAELSGRIDLLLIPTGIQWHAPMTLAGLRAGAHVLVEKPVAATMAEVEAMQAAAAHAGRLVAVGYQDLYEPTTHEIKRRVLDGAIGPLRAIRVQGLWPRSAAYYARNSWAGRLRVNGSPVLDSPVNNAFAHFLMLALFWAGSTAEAAAEIVDLEAELYRAGGIESFDTAGLRLRTLSGTEILLLTSHAGAEDLAPEVRLVGEEGTIVWTYERAYTVSRRGVPAETQPVPTQFDVRLRVLDAVVERLETGAGFVVTPQHVREHTRLINALHEFFPIHDVPSRYLETTNGPLGEFRRVRDLDQLTAEAIETGRLFSEVGAPWARPGEGARSLRGYRGWME